MSGGTRTVGSVRSAPLSFADWCGGKSSLEEHVDWSGAYIAYVGAYASCGGQVDDRVQHGRDSVVFRRVSDKRRVSGRYFGGDGAVPSHGVARKYAIKFGSFDSEFREAVGVDVGEGSKVRGAGCESLDESELRVDDGVGARGASGDVCTDGRMVSGQFNRCAVQVGLDEACDDKDVRVARVGGDFGVGNDSGVDQGARVEVVRGKHYESNRRKRLSRKKSRARFSDDWRKPESDSEIDVRQDVPTLAEYISKKIDDEFLEGRALEVEMKVAERVAMQKARKTLAEKWAFENELAAAKAKRSLEVLMAQDVQAEIKKQSTYLRLQTEKNMVGMEKAHQFLKKTGNVPGFAQTVLSDEGLTDGSSASPASPGECTISPDSSASMKEFREVVKQKADLEEKLARICKMTKVSLEDLDDYDKNTWSLKSENYEKLDRMYPGGYILDPVPDYVDYDPPTHGYLKF